MDVERDMYRKKKKKQEATGKEWGRCSWSKKTVNRHKEIGE